MTAEGMLTHIRTNLGSFLNSDVAGFRPYNDESAARWSSSDPIGAVMSFDMMVMGINIDDGAVLAASVTSSSWIFTTVETWDDGSHPVSGNRQFGFYQNGGGSVTFYTRGVDRISDKINLVVAGDTPFEQADKLWKGFQSALIGLVNGNGGSASVSTTFSERVDWDQYHDKYAEEGKN